MSNTVDKEAIEPILLKHIIEAQREFLKPDLTDEQRKINAKWYLISSTPSYRGVIAGINELLQSTNEATQKELVEAREEIKSWKESKESWEHIAEDKDKEIAELKNRLEEYERPNGKIGMK